MASAVGSLVFFALLARCLGAASIETHNDGIANFDGLVDSLWIIQPLLPGTAPLTGHRSRSFDLSARACLSNGTNYCFGNNVNYCSSCGVCCQGSAEAKWCCSSDSTCCGSQCCAEGQKCSNGRCYLPVVSVTITSTFFTTASHKLTQIATVFENVVQTSTINSVVDITVSSLATQTDVHWVTTTVSDARRALPSQGADALRDGSIVKRDSLGTFNIARVAHQLVKLFYRRSNCSGDCRREVDSRHASKRQETEQPLSATASTATVYDYITQTVDKTSILSSTTTRSATSTVLTTLYQTATRVLDAQTTVSVTSTLTVRPPKPTTITKTEFASPLTDSPTTSQPSTSPTRTPGLVIPTSKPSNRSGLSTPAIAGIAAGAAVAALVILGAAVLICLKRRRRRRAAAAAIAEDVDAYYDIAPPPSSQMFRREPKMPPVSIFAPAEPRHHGAAYTPMAAVSPDLEDQQQQRATSSSHTAATTLVGSAVSPSQGGGAAAKGSPRTSTGLSPPVEVAGADVPPRYEIEGSSPPLGSGNSNGGGYNMWAEGHRRTGSDVNGRSRGDGGYFAINF